MHGIIREQAPPQHCSEDDIDNDIVYTAVPDNSLTDWEPASAIQTAGPLRVWLYSQDQGQLTAQSGA